jgi:hypothetical protein
MDKGADLYNPESAKAVITTQDHWSMASKVQAVCAYDKFAKTFSITWSAPEYRAVHKVPFIPLKARLTR